jgi:hypothetical protein
MQVEKYHQPQCVDGFKSFLAGDSPDLFRRASRVGFFEVTSCRQNLKHQPTAVAVSKLESDASEPAGVNHPSQPER